MKLSSISLWLAIALPLSLLTACNCKSGDQNMRASTHKENKGSSKSKKMKKDGSKKAKDIAAPVAPATPMPEKN